MSKRKRVSDDINCAKGIAKFFVAKPRTSVNPQQTIDDIPSCSKSKHSEETTNNSKILEVETRVQIRNPSKYATTKENQTSSEKLWPDKAARL